ncbi:MAG: CoA pyrophosphatase [Alphaproteobacteria bacterium]|nr:CoA pyrophosphatase [Alphaproteobacteria bacterium]
MAFSTREDFDRRAATRLAPADAVLDDFLRTDFDLNPGWAISAPKPYRRAAVLIVLVDRGEDYGVLLTLRPETMTQHAGQIAFPGGRIDEDDVSPLAAALREAREEVGLDGPVTVLGQADPYLTSSGYVVSPFLVRAENFTPVIDPKEVAAVFETPLSFLMTPGNHQRHERAYNGGLRAYYAMPHNGRYIWGATAGMIKSVYDRLYLDADGDGR